MYGRTSGRTVLQKDGPPIYYLGLTAPSGACATRFANMRFLASVIPSSLTAVANRRRGKTHCLALFSLEFAATGGVPIVGTPSGYLLGTLCGAFSRESLAKASTGLSSHAAVALPTSALEIRDLGLPRQTLVPSPASLVEALSPSSDAACVLLCLPRACCFLMHRCVA